ncbi:molybdopterin-dependent oxidoreductase alpha subunit [Sphingomonas sp. PP-F2F-G114-C0414]|uniref:FdhF/YdeP family oxidoreductase n=1 Tax=Sphingomonas sp. PP-F2F-G114-C0414 TaxID=2135662 RepID=UPI000EF954E0|nr:FdhF/YdeP family oxidoreductase [Sphingomonas sp. PP-F2F-G114-C0414]RMB36232.1 molybdopterin-dependent oxidoreductase alpha subunit [Sphingomonas sp. PP-F2F-G114-C0414]
MRDKRPDGIADYTGPAGGWGALKAVAVSLKAQQIVVRGGQTLLKSNQPDGFDCPSCAWPDPKHTSSFEFCENGAKAVAWESTAKTIGAEFFSTHSVSDIWKQSDHWIEDQGRVTEPLRYNAATDHYEVVSWADAMREIGAGLAAVPDPNQAEFYTSGRCSNEAAFLFQLFVRLYGTNNFPDCSNMCHEATSVGLPKSIGIGKGTVSLEDFDHADLILSIGHNPGTNHPRMMATLREVSKRGGKIIVFNPLKERSLERFESPQSVVEMVTMSATPIASSYYQVKVGGDAAALKGIAKALIALDEAAEVSGGEPALDHAFIAEHTAGLDDYIADLATTEWADIERSSGLSRKDLEEVALAYSKSKSTICCYGMGVTQHRTGTTNVQQIANLLLLRGNMGRPGAGICPLRGHSNVQGDRTVGITERPMPLLLDNMRDVFGFEPPREHGHSVVESIAAMRDGHAKAIVCLGGNLAIASSDPQACAEGFRNLDLAVHITTKLNRTQLLMAKATYVLPCLGRTELDMQATGQQAVTVEDSMSMVHASRGFLMPPGDNVKSEIWIVGEIAKATFAAKGSAPIEIDWDAYVGDYSLIRDKIEAVFPAFADYNARIRKPGGFHLPNSAAMREWNTDSGKANFIVAKGVEEDESAGDPTVLRLTTLRAHDQYNTTVYSLDDRYRGVFGRRDILFMNERDMARLGHKEGDVVDIATALQFARADRVVQKLMLVRYALPDGCVASYYPETQPLIALEDHDPQSFTPSYKSIPVTVRPAAADMGSDRGVVRAGIVGHESKVPA